MGGFCILGELLLRGENTTMVLLAVFSLIILSDVVYGGLTIYKVLMAGNDIFENLGFLIFETTHFLYYLMIWMLIR